MSQQTAITSGAVSVATSSTPVVPYRIGRRHLTISNDGTNIIYLALQVGGTAPTAVASSGVRLAAAGSSGSTYSIDGFAGAIAGIALTGATTGTIAEF